MVCSIEPPSFTGILFQVPHFVDLVVSIIPDSVNVKEDASFTVDIVTNVPYDFEFEVILTYANGTAKG